MVVRRRRGLFDFILSSVVLFSVVGRTCLAQDIPTRPPGQATPTPTPSTLATPTPTPSAPTKGSEMKEPVAANLKGQPPAPPAGLRVVAGNAQVSLTWVASPEATAYNVKRSLNAGGPYTLVATGLAVTSFTETGLKTGTSYYYVVSAVNANGESANSSESAAHMPAPELKVFGRDLFVASPSTYEPNPEAAVPADYVLGPGDTLAVLVYFGTTEYERSNVTISPNGNIYLKLIGTLPLAEKTLAQAQTELRQQYVRFYRRFDLKVQVVGRRSIPIFVVGEVVRPGKYLLSSLATVFTALYAAGGPTENGSLRRIRLMRRQRLAAEIDIYSYLINGRAVDLPLKPGDTVFVPINGKLVTVDGEVRRPAKYELRDKDTLGGALALAGGTTSNSTDRVRLSRVDEKRQRKVTELVLPLTAGLPLQDGDEVFATPVLSYVRNAVHLAGAVNRPGDYAVEQAPTVAALLRLAEGTTPDAYAEQAMLTRLTDNLQRSQLAVNLRAILSGEPGADVPLQPGDTVQVYDRTELPELLDTVVVNGEVVKPGSYPYQPRMRVADLLHIAFGVTTKAYLSQAQLYRYKAGEQPEMVSVDLTRALAGSDQDNVALRPRDQLVVQARDKVRDQIVRVDGEVAKPGVIAFYQGLRISDAIFAAGGLNPEVALDRALLIRLNEKTYAEELIELSLRDVLAHLPDRDLLMRNQDRLTIYPSSQMGELREVRVEGAVGAPGTYHFSGDMRVSQLLFLARSAKENAYAPRADLYRLRADGTTEIIPVNLGKVAAGGLSADNPMLQPRDRLVVHTREEMEETPKVKIDGFVRQPGEYLLASGMKLSDLLHLAGGLQPEAQPQAELYRVQDGTVHARSIALQLTNAATVPETDVVLEPRDLVSILGNANYLSATATIAVEGMVQHPGVYPAFQKTQHDPKTLYQVLTEAGGLIPDAYPAGIVLYREQAAIHTQRQQQELSRTLRYLDNSVGIMSPDTTPTPAAGIGSTPAAGTMIGPGGALAATAAARTMTTPGGGTMTGTAGGTEPAGTNTSVSSSTNAATPAVGATQGGPPTEGTATPIDQARSQNIANISRSLAQVITTDRGNTVVLVTPPRSMQEQKFSLTLPVDAEPILRSKGQQGDFGLEPGDVLYVPRRPTTITVLGGVINNGSLVYQGNKTLEYYLNAAGGVSPDGEVKRAVVMRLNGRISPGRQIKAIEPGDIIIVPTKFIYNTIRTKGRIESALASISEAALSFLPLKAF